jgi:uncharacterized protein (TIGR02284 family)
MIHRIDLNSASEEELSRIAGVGRQGARSLIRHRPFKSIDEIRRIPGFNDKMLADLRRGGAMVGHRQPAASANNGRRTGNRGTFSAARPSHAHTKRMSRQTTRGRSAAEPPRSFPQPTRSRASVRIYRNPGYGSDRVPATEAKEAADIDTDRLLAELNNLVQLDIDAIRAYQEAIDSSQDTAVRRKLESFKGDHERHVSKLSAEVEELGGTPAKSRDLPGFLIEGFTAVHSIAGTEGALKAMRVNEMVTNSTYEKAAGNELYPTKIRALIEQNYRDEKRHLAWIEKYVQRTF